MPIANNAVVSFHYTLSDDTGTTLDSSSGEEPLTYLHGTSSIIPGLERELEGREVGDNFNVAIEPTDGYGDVNDELMMEIPLDSLNHIEDLEPGMQLRSQGQDGQTQMLMVEAVGEATATLNANHPLAGKTLHFEVTVEAVREATTEELEHGHAH